MKRKIGFLLIAFAFVSGVVFADIYGAVRGVVHDPQHLPIPGATVELKAKLSDWERTITTDANGEFQFNGRSAGRLFGRRYRVAGFAGAEQDVTVISGTVPVVHIPIAIGHSE